MGTFLRDRAIYVYDFWNGIYLWFQRQSLPSWLSFLDPLEPGAPAWRIWVFLGVVAVLYLAFCLLMVKLAKIPLGLIDSHMRAHNARIGLNMPLYIAAIALILFDEMVFGSPGRQSDGLLHIGVFTVVAGVLFLIAVFRMIRRAGVRFVYFIPLQAAEFALIYLYILLWTPAAIILLVIGLTGASFTAKEPGVGYVCPHCGGGFGPGVACACGRSIGSYDGHRFPRPN